MRVGIPLQSSISFEQPVFKINEAYIRLWRTLGFDIKMLLPEDIVDETTYQSIDVLFLPGGPDVESTRYLKYPDGRCKKPAYTYELLGITLEKFYEQGKFWGELPIVGVCRGFQELNVMLGGTLTPHDNYVPQSKKFRGQHVEYMKVLDYGGLEEFHIEPINSIHHQCVYNEDLAQGWDAVAYALKNHNDKLLVATQEELNIEAAMNTELKVAAVQYHPEELRPQDSGFKFFQTLVQAVTEYQLVN